MTESGLTPITLNRIAAGLHIAEWSGTPDEEMGSFTIGGRYVIRFLELSIAIWSESIVGDDKPILSMRYYASLVSGEPWTKGNNMSDMVPYGEWYFDARDDLGTEYEYQQGVSGYLDSDRTIFDSEIDFEPDIPADARWVEVRFMDRHELDQPVHIVHADVPPLQEFLVS